MSEHKHKLLCYGAWDKRSNKRYDMSVTIIYKTREFRGFYSIAKVFFAKYCQWRSARALRRALARILQATPYFARRQMLPRGVSRKFFVAKFCRYTVYHRATEGILMSMSIGMVVALLRDEKWGAMAPLALPFPPPTEDGEYLVYLSCRPRNSPESPAWVHRSHASIAHAQTI